MCAHTQVHEYTWSSSCSVNWELCTPLTTKVSHSYHPLLDRLCCSGRWHSPLPSPFLGRMGFHQAAHIVYLKRKISCISDRYILGTIWRFPLCLLLIIWLYIISYLTQQFFCFLQANIFLIMPSCPNPYISTYSMSNDRGKSPAFAKRHITWIPAYLCSVRAMWQKLIAWWMANLPCML